MTNGIKISQLDAATSLDGTEGVPVVQSGNTVKATTDQIKTLAQTDVPAENIIGTLSSATVPAANVSGVLTNATIDGSDVTGTITTATVPAANVSGALTNATIAVSGITGTLAINQGGTGQTTANSAFNALAPSQTSNSGKYLTTDGSNTSWGTISTGITVDTTPISGGTSGNVLYHNGTVVGEYAQVPTANGGTGLSTFTAANNAIYSTSSSVLAAGTLPVAAGGTGQTTASAAFNALSPITSTGDLVVGNGVNSATRLGIGSNGYVLTSNGTTASWAAATGTVLSVSNSDGTLTVSPTTGAVVASLDLSHANTWTAAQTFPVATVSNGIWINSQTISANYTIASGYSGSSAGPISIASGVAVTISSGSRWVVL
mgnify:CR=1 FL=1